MSEVVVVGGGAAGMMAALSAADKGADVLLLEKNEKLGKKLFITGKGRCNLTNGADCEEIISNVLSNPKFLYSAIYGFTNDDVCSFFEENGCPLKEERGKRIFPASDKSSDVIKTLEKALRRAGVKIRLNTGVKDILIKGEGEDKKVSGVVLDDNSIVESDSLILATGGLSYPSTGSTGDGHRFSEKLGHEIITCVPALVPLKIKEDYVKNLAGLSLKNVKLKAVINGKNVFEETGEMLFTHEGVSGPLVLSAGSRLVRRMLDDKCEVNLYIDLKPALTGEKLTERIKRDLNKYSKKHFENSLSDLLPKSLIPVIVRLSGIDPYKQSAQINGEEIRSLVHILKNLNLTVTGTGGFNEAIITSGGVSVKGINPSTMGSKFVKGLFFAGELMDVDAYTGGYNLQIAWSTGHLAGESAALNRKEI